jgi:type IV secretion system protein VirD4
MIADSRKRSRSGSDGFRKLVHLGYAKEPDSQKIGFQHCINNPALPKGLESSLTDAREHITVDDELPIMTFCPTGGGKGVSAIIPTLLANVRSMIVVDPKGENFAVTARRRLELGHRVYALDPFNIRTKKSDGLNPLDLLNLPNVCIESEAVTLAAAIGHDFQSKREAFWDQHALGLISGLLALAASGHYPQNLRTLRDHLVGEDPIHKIAVALDLLAAKQATETLAYRELAAFFHQSERETRPSVLASAGAYAKIFNVDRVIKTLEKSTLKLRDLIVGKPMTVYLIIPSDKLHSHRALLRLWLTTIMIAMQSRTSRPAESTLLLIDECGQLENFELLQTAVTLCRGYGVQPWLFFQSLQQLKKNYGEDWRTFIDNAGAVQAFKFSNQFSVDEWGKFFQRTPEQLLALPPDEQLLYISGKGTIESKRYNYLTDPEFCGHFDPNPAFVHRPLCNERN